MTRSEIALLLAINKQIGSGAGNALADALCNNCPDIKSDDMRPPLEAQIALWNRLSDDIAAVNERLPQAVQYSRERDIRPTQDSIPDGAYTFTSEQLDVIAEQVATKKKSVNSLNASDALDGNKGGRKAWKNGRFSLFGKG